MSTSAAEEDFAEIANFRLFRYFDRDESLP